MRIFKTFDYELVAKLNKTVHDLHHKLNPTYFKEYDLNSMIEFYESVINNPSFHFLVVEDENKYVGYAWIEIRTYSENVFRKSYQSVFVNQISVDESRRNRGYGTKLMDEVCRVAKENNIDLIELDYWTNNSIAKDFYKKHGFEVYREFVFKKV